MNYTENKTNQHPAETPTPKTDRAISHYWNDGFWSESFANFARTLEREAAALLAKNADMEEAMKATLDALEEAVNWSKNPTVPLKLPRHTPRPQGGTKP